MWKASFPDSHKPIERMCVRCYVVSSVFLSFFRCFRNQIYFIMIIVMTSSFACYLNSMLNHWWFQMKTSFFKHIHFTNSYHEWIKKMQKCGERKQNERKKKTCDVYREHYEKNPFHSITSDIGACKKTPNGNTQENENILCHTLVALLSPFFGLCSYSLIFLPLLLLLLLLPSFFCAPLWHTARLSHFHSLSVPFSSIVRFNG